MRSIAALLLAVAMVACSSSDDKGDSAALRACRQFRDLVRDIDAGLLGDQELIARSGDIHATAMQSEELEVRDAARGYALTLAQGRDRPATVEALDAACSDLGA
jgi:hypothetical protein